MKIAQSNVNLVSSHSYYEENQVTVESNVLTRGAFLESLQNQQNKMDLLEVSKDSGGQAIGSETYTSLKPSKSEYLSPLDSTLEEQLSELRASLLERILSLLQLLDGGNSRKGYQNILRQTSNMLTSNSFVKVTTVHMTHIEEEATTFSGRGCAVTEDGRTIDFGVDFSLSKKLVSYAGMSVSSAVSLIDPLIINVGNDVTNISDQSFYFDLDADGTEDKISSLGSGSGFLSYDKNGDGIINDGSELFGTKSGNGFKDLSQYDSDNNGWIDENDEIYDKLSVWTRNDDGTDSLLSLKEADVGAIYLGSADTQYSNLNSNFVMNAMMRKSGIFLKESGGVGTVQQVDMAAL